MLPSPLLSSLATGQPTARGLWSDAYMSCWKMEAIVCLSVIVYVSCFVSGAPQDVCEAGGKTFQAIFGARTPLIESFLIKRKLMGPCWVTVRNPKVRGSILFRFVQPIKCVHQEIIRNRSDHSPAHPRPIFILSSPHWFLLTHAKVTCGRHNPERQPPAHQTELVTPAANPPANPPKNPPRQNR